MEMFYIYTAQRSSDSHILPLKYGLCNLGTVFSIVFNFNFNNYMWWATVLDRTVLNSVNIPEFIFAIYNSKSVSKWIM